MVSTCIGSLRYLLVVDNPKSGKENPNANSSAAGSQNSFLG
jgi:hypothetical protein